MCLGDNVRTEESRECKLKGGEVLATRSSDTMMLREACDFCSELTTWLSRRRVEEAR